MTYLLGKQPIHNAVIGHIYRLKNTISVILRGSDNRDFRCFSRTAGEQAHSRTKGIGGFLTTRSGVFVPPVGPSIYNGVLETDIAVI